MTPARSQFVVVPHTAGPLVDLDADGGRRRDELDDLIDDLFPDVEDGPGPFDVGLVVLGLALLGWAFLADGPGAAAVFGLIALGLGCVLPVRAAWRRIEQRSRSRRTAAGLADGTVLDTSTPTVAAMVRSYESLFTLDGTDDPDLIGRARAGGHAALSEVASLLAGRPPSSPGEHGYAQERAEALASLAEEVRRLKTRPAEADHAAHGDGRGIDPDVLVAARLELDRVAPFTSVSRIDDLTDELRRRNGGGDGDGTTEGPADRG